jgi:broad specificity polyphosphatase/5'/3'-nucleotidase SurE
VDEFVRRESPRGTVYYWQAGLTKIIDESEDTDAICLMNRMISITPIHYRLGGYQIGDDVLRQDDLEKLLYGS